MAFLVSPGVEVKEKDLTNIIPAVSTSIGGYAGLFEWGPCSEVTNISSEKDLIDKFGYPRVSTNAGSNNRADWYTAANFLAYTNNLQVVRVLPESARNAVSEAVAPQVPTISIIVTGTTSVSGVTISVPYDGYNTVDITPVSGDTEFDVVTKLENALVTAGVLGVVNEGIAVSYEKGTYALPDTTVINSITFSPSETSVSAEASEWESVTSIRNAEDFLVEREGLVDGSVYARYPGRLGDSIGVILIDAEFPEEDFQNTPLFGSVRASDYFEARPQTSVWGEANHSSNLKDEVHVIVYTVDTQLTGTAGDVLETYAFLSKAKNGKTADGGVNYYVDAINDQSQYIWINNEETFAAGSVDPDNGLAIGNTLTSSTTSSFNVFFPNAAIPGVRQYELKGGRDGDVVTDGEYTEAWSLLSDVDTYDVNLLITGNASTVVQKYVIELGETRKDCITFVSPSYSAAVTNPSAAKVVDYFNNDSTGFNSTSYAVFDSGWKRQYDRYNDEYFWISLNADIAGLSARTDATNDAWWSPAGLNRGQIKNVVKLSFNPNQADRDALYVKRVNPVVTFRGQGTLLYGDKTALSRPSAFDRINVRRLFIVLEKAIATAAKYQLFEFNDDYTRRVFLNAVEPYLSNIKTRRGVYDFKVVCDDSNNTPEVVDGNRFVADIYIKPTRSINFITLNFVAVRSGVNFNEVVGA